MSEEFGFKNTTVISWCENRDMPQEAYRRLLELDCDLSWLLTGITSETKNASAVDADEAMGLFSGVFSEAIKNATEIRQLLDDGQNRVLEGRLSADDFERITADLIDALVISLTNHRENAHNQNENSGAS